MGNGNSGLAGKTHSLSCGLQLLPQQSNVTVKTGAWLDGSESWFRVQHHIIQRLLDDERPSQRKSESFAESCSDVETIFGRCTLHVAETMSTC